MWICSALVGLAFLFRAPMVSPIRCNIGYGQRGLKRSFGFSWPRNCPNTQYCWQTVTTSIGDMKKLFDFAWDDYYHEYYVMACGGEYGSKTYEDLYQQYRGENGRLVDRKKLPGQKYRFNVTAPTTITGRGGTAEMDIKYVCGGDFCSSAARLQKWSVLIIAITATLVVTVATGLVW